MKAQKLNLPFEGVQSPTTGILGLSCTVTCGKTNDIHVTDQIDETTKEILTTVAKCFCWQEKWNRERGGTVYDPGILNTSWLDAPLCGGHTCQRSSSHLPGVPHRLLYGAAMVGTDSPPGDGVEQLPATSDRWFSQSTPGSSTGNWGCCSKPAWERAHRRVHADLRSDLQNRPVASQLYYSILQYMNSICFIPGIR